MMNGKEGEQIVWNTGRHRHVKETQAFEMWDKFTKWFIIDISKKTKLINQSTRKDKTAYTVFINKAPVLKWSETSVNFTILENCVKQC